jgi:penicillin-binding protein A
MGIQFSLMLRREALTLMLSACARSASSFPGVAVVLDVPSGRTVAVDGGGGSALAPPGSTMKPFTLATLLHAGKLQAADTMPCPGRLVIDGRSLACSHPAIGTAMDVRTALAYSCNCFVAQFAQRFAPGELAANLRRYGLPAHNQAADAQRLQALGESGVLATAADLAQAYRRLSVNAPELVRAGLEDAVEFGTAQLARVAGTTVAGKTGSVKTAEGAAVAWFAGFAPSRSPKLAVAVMLQGRSGGADAAPVAARILREHL